MRIGWAILAGLVLGGGLAWWLGRTPPGQAPDAQTRQAQPPTLYRWRDENGTLQITQTPPPKGRPYQRVPLDGAGGDRVTPLH